MMCVYVFEEWREQQLNHIQSVKDMYKLLGPAERVWLS